MYERAFVASHVDDLHADLLSWLTIPSISADPARATDVRRNAEWPAAEPDAKTVVVYGHHDVQPVDPEELWERPPFEPTIVGTELFARGASDDKGQLLFHLLAVRAHLAATGRTSPAVTLRFLIEGEEESGSPHFASLLRARRDRLDCDVIVVTDTGVFGRDTPSICMGMRGLADGEIHFHGPAFMTTCCRLPTPNGPRSASCRSTKMRSLKARRRRGRRSARPDIARWNGSGRARPRKSMASGAATPGRGTRRSCPAMRTRSCRSGWSPIRIRRAFRNRWRSSYGNARRPGLFRRSSSTAAG